MTAASRIRSALEAPAVLLFAWYLRVSCSRCDLSAGRMTKKREADGFSFPFPPDDVSPPPIAPPISLGGRP